MHAMKYNKDSDFFTINNKIFHKDFIDYIEQFEYKVLIYTHKQDFQYEFGDVVESKQFFKQLFTALGITGKGGVTQFATREDYDKYKNLKEKK